MPIYEYRCNACGRDFEELVFGDENPPCPHCGAAATHKLMSCCRHRGGSSSDGFDAGPAPSAGGGGGCAGCAGGHCSTCGH